MENYQPENNYTGKKSKKKPKALGIVLLVIIVLAAAFLFFKPVYLMKGLGQQEMGVKIRAGEIVDIVGPGGIYNDFGLYVKLESYNIEGVSFNVADDEVFTKDMQPVYVEIRGQVFRPSLTSIKSVNNDGTISYFSKDEIARHYVNYRQSYTDNGVLKEQLDGFSRQAMKVCVGQNDLRGNAVAEGRDTLRNCIENELEKLTNEIGMYVNNIVVTDVQASEQAMQVINETNQYLLDAEKAKAQAQKLEEEGKANAVQKEAEIRVQQAAQQETARQKVTLAELEEKELVARREVLKAEKENVILEQELNAEKAKAAELQAQADLAKERLMAQIYEENPGYYQLKISEMNASAIKSTDKFIIVPEGSMPQLVLGRDVIPTMNVGNTTAGTEVPLMSTVGE
ncbi:MAG: hypothetical protein II969_07100 [Anaerolineaceae bacterium]|nr:hypothetical protein [Anaerolineaceae bacterium]